MRDLFRKYVFRKMRGIHGYTSRNVYVFFNTVVYYGR
jgi:hypothetical protein